MADDDSDPTEYVRVRRASTTAFICLDLSGGASLATLIKASAHALGLSCEVRLVRDTDRGAPLELEGTLVEQGVGVGDLLLALCRDDLGDWEVVKDGDGGDGR